MFAGIWQLDAKDSDCICQGINCPQSKSIAFAFGLNQVLVRITMATFSLAATKLYCNNTEIK